MVWAQALKEQIPEGDQRGKEAVIEAFALQSGQLAQSAVGQQQDKEAQELGRGEGSWERGSFEVVGVFLGWY